MADPLGWFDEGLRVEGWFDSGLLVEGWFDELLIQSAAGGAITGTLAATEAQDAAAFTGVLVYSGSLAATEQQDSATFNGALAYSGTLAATEQQDVAAFAGDVAGGAVTGDLSATEAQDTASFSGAIIFFEQTGGGQSPLKRKKVAKPILVAEPLVIAPVPKVDIAALKTRADAAEAVVARLEAQVATAKRERTVARLKTDHAAAMVALEEARAAEWQAILRDEDEFFLLAA